MRGVAGFIGRWLWRVAKVITVVLALTLTLVLVFAAIATSRGFAQTTGTITVPGLHAPVTVARDAAGIFQITADDPHDLFMAQGYVHAQERMWQMEISRRIGAGRLSEIFGKSQIDKDTYIRTLGWRVAAQKDLAAMSTDSRAILQAYSDGVNAWITEHNGSLSTPFVVTGLLSGTGLVGGFALEPWTPLDTATWQKVQAWSLGGNVDSEIFRLLADERLGDPAKTDELFPPYDPAAPVITPRGVSGARGAATAAAQPANGGGAGFAVSDSSAAALGDLARLGSAVANLAGLDGGAGMVGGHGVGSNNWVVSGEHTLGNKPVLANDPHLGLGMPSVWIMNGLHCRTVSDACRWDVVGVTFPGAPAVILGHNAHIAWGATNVNPDTQDLFVETVDPSDPGGHYISAGRSIPFDARHETIKVAGGADVEIDVRSTSHGVVLSDVDTRLKDGPVLALRWTSTAEVDLTLESFLRIDLATSFADFRAAFDTYNSPSQNFVYADVDGHIGYVLPGLIPIRDGPNGDRVRDGASGANEWTDYVARDKLPWQLDPKSGVIISANNAPVDASYPHWLGDEWDPGYRAARISRLLGDLGNRITADDARAIQMDDYVLRADQVIPALATLGPTLGTDDGRLLLSRISEWDRKCGTDSAGCAAYMTVELALQRAIFDDELGPLARDYVGSTMAWQALLKVLSEPESGWWDVTTPGSADVHDPTGRAGAAIDAMAAELRAAYGDPATWTWGRLHTIHFKEATLGSSGLLPLEWYFDPPARPVPGADGAINNNYYRFIDGYPDPADPGFVPKANHELFAVTNGPSLRFSIELNDLDGARIVITTGQSGNPFDRHYEDLIPLWANGDTVPLPFSPDNIKAATTETLTLTP